MIFIHIYSTYKVQYVCSGCHLKVEGSNNHREIPFFFLADCVCMSTTGSCGPGWTGTDVYMDCCGHHGHVIVVWPEEERLYPVKLTDNIIFCPLLRSDQFTAHSNLIHYSH